MSTNAADSLPASVRRKLVIADSSADVELESPGASIDDQGDRVLVATKGGDEYDASVVVVATSRLTSAKLDTSRAGVQTPNAFHKLIALVEGPVDAIYVQRTDYENHPLIHIRRDLPRPDGLTKIVGFSVDPTLDDNDHGRIREAFAEMSGVSAARIVDVVAHNWVTDPYTMGGTAFTRKGLVANLEEINAPEGRVSFAVSDLRFGDFNTAVERGMKAAASAIKAHAGVLPGRRTPSADAT